VYGDSSRDRLVAIIVPNREQNTHVFGKVTVSDQEFTNCCKEKQLEAAILAELEAIAIGKKVPGYEKIRAVLCEPEPWTTDNDLMIPTFKLRRKKLADKYRKEIVALYGYSP
jgi:long-chain acyl-CoA synthetase